MIAKLNYMSSIHALSTLIVVYVKFAGILIKNAFKNVKNAMFNVK